ncbi:metal-dependent transcriptional regulator [uncultured Parolsenella sp.]|uniref:metal-dependent transcriptional regulator n=1 Tax=uncultured Parolsenella sp. TaxID=2083008 RepID=UPI002659943C|nr:metal-dependent transcriptional regulator [uncultured Parolsenella sp.]
MKAKNEGHALTNAGEDYLEAIYCLILEHPGDDSVRSVDVSERLDVTKASVNKALSSLKDGGFVDQTHYGRVKLTEAGRGYAAEVWRRHRMLRTFLTVELGVDEEVADEEACLMEHALSADTSRHLLEYLERQGVTIDKE